MLAALAVRGRARADEPGYESHVKAEPRAAFVTVIDAKQPSVRIVSVADLIERRAGVFVRSRGGLGAFTSVAVRGSEANEVAILVDGVPLTRAASGVIDLAQLPVAGLDRVEIYRGAPPAELGAEAIGGAINLVTRKGEAGRRWRLSAGAGSFGARSASAGLSGTFGGLRADVAVAYHGATGDFTFYDNAGTLTFTGDDRVSVRRNNHFDQLSLDASLGTARWRVSARGFLKWQGVPGFGSFGVETPHARLVTGRLLSDAALFGQRGRLAWRVQASLLFERNGFANPPGPDVGPFGPNVSEGEAVSPALVGRVAVPWGRHQRWSLFADLRGEHRRGYDLLAPLGRRFPSGRLVFGIGAADELSFLGGRVRLEPALRLDLAHSLLTLGAEAAVPDTQAFVSPRVSIAVDAASWLSVRGSAGRFVRFPTLLELFGDGVFILARPGLAPEKAWGGDVGPRLSLCRARVSAFVETAFFGRQVEDFIAFVPGGAATTAQNIGEVRMLGLEVRAELTVPRWLLVRLDYTYLAATNLTRVGGTFGKQLPGRPANELNARVELMRKPFSAFYELSYVGVIFRDAANTSPLPERVLHAVGFAFERRWLHFSLELRNLADLRVVDLPLGGSAQAGRTVPYALTDFFNYPLPGRSVYATVAIVH
jgi:iron complex outermembrane receptor protein